MTTSLARSLVRAGAAGLLLALVGLGGAGFADTPSGWPESPHVSAFHFLLIIFLIPLGLWIIITALVVLPSLMHPGRPSSAVVTTDVDEPHLDANLH